jgi:hypothetical protein
VPAGAQHAATTKSTDQYYIHAQSALKSPYRPDSLKQRKPDRQPFYLLHLLTAPIAAITKMTPLPQDAKGTTINVIHIR